MATELGEQGSGVKKVARTEQSLFTDATIASFEGMPITLGHPTEDVTAKNWKQLAVGSVRNVKRDGDMLAGEAWIYDENAIKQIQEKGIEELSCGYSCDVFPKFVYVDQSGNPLMDEKIHFSADVTGDLDTGLWQQWHCLDTASAVLFAKLLCDGRFKLYRWGLVRCSDVRNLSATVAGDYEERGQIELVISHEHIIQMPLNPIEQVDVNINNQIIEIRADR